MQGGCPIRWRQVTRRFGGGWNGGDEGRQELPGRGGGCEGVRMMQRRRGVRHQGSVGFTGCGGAISTHPSTDPPSVPQQCSGPARRAAPVISGTSKEHHQAKAGSAAIKALASQHLMAAELLQSAQCPQPRACSAPGQCPEGTRHTARANCSKTGSSMPCYHHACSYQHFMPRHEHQQATTNSRCQ